jgi:class 3 adenylate cyclase
MSGDLGESEKVLNTAMALASKANNPRYVAEIKIRMSRIKGLGGDRKGAIKLAEEALLTGEEVGDNPIQRNALISLIIQYKALGMHEKALEYYEQQIALEEEIKNEENQRQVIRQEYAYEYQKQALADSLTYAAEKELQVKEIQRQKMLRNGFMGGFILVGVFAAVFFYQRRRISKEKQRSENLLLNILPEEIAQELKINGKAEARDFDLVSILFTDFKGFTEQSAKLSAVDLVHEINHCFEAFDGIIEKYNVEKIKTIGDAYMAAGGLPVPNANSVKNTVLAALEMQAFILARKSEKGEFAFEMRVGIHTGPVVAGIVGVKKFQYDIWGDTVNTAARMESSGEVGKVNISQATYELLKEEADFAFESRGKIEAKGKGEMEMLFVTLKK